jgi:hypothetical protein
LPPPAFFSEPAAGAVQDQPLPGAVVGPPVRTIAAAGDAMATSPRTAKVTRPVNLARAGVVLNARVCAAEVVCWG